MKYKLSELYQRAPKLPKSVGKFFYPNSSQRLLSNLSEIKESCYMGSCFMAKWIIEDKELVSFPLVLTKINFTGDDFLKAKKIIFNYQVINFDKDESLFSVCKSLNDYTNLSKDEINEIIIEIENEILKERAWIFEL